MTNMLEKKFANKDLGIELKSFIDKQQNVWFIGKDVAEILGYSKERNAIERHVSVENKMTQLSRKTSVGGVKTTPQQSKSVGGPETGRQQNNTKVKCCRPETGRQQNNNKVKCSPGKTPGQQNNTKVKCCRPETPGQQSKSVGVAFRHLNKNDTRGKYCTFINEPGFYELVFGSKLEFAKKFRQWVFNTVLPSIRKYGQYKMFDSPWNKMIMIGNERDLHYKVVQLIRNYYLDSILVAGLGENQDTEEKRLDSYKKGYLRGTPDLMILNYHKDYRGLCIEFKSPTNNYEVSESQIKMKEKYRSNDYAFILSNDYDKISKLIHKYMAGVRIPCKYCPKAFRSKTTLNNHYKVIHRIEKNI